jgi:hypothetical protein
MTCNGMAVSKVIGWEMIAISGRCYGKNGEEDVIDFGCVKCCRIGILRTWPIYVGTIRPASVYAWRRCLWRITALGCIHIPLNQTQHNVHFVDGRSLHTKVSKLSCVCVLIAMLYRSGSATMHSHCWCTCVSVPPRPTRHHDTPPTLLIRLQQHLHAYLKDLKNTR